MIKPILFVGLFCLTPSFINVQYVKPHIMNPNRHDIVPRAPQMMNSSFMRQHTSSMPPVAQNITVSLLVQSLTDLFTKIINVLKQLK